MKLADLRKLTVKKQLRIYFQLTNGMECTIDEHGVARVPALTKTPDFNLERELETAGEFGLEPVVRADKKAPPKRQTLRREQLAAMTAAAPASASTEHEEE